MTRAAVGTSRYSVQRYLPSSCSISRGGDPEEVRERESNKKDVVKPSKPQ